MSWDFPLPDQLDQHPQLGPLAILEAALEVTENAVAAAHPELWLEAEDGSPAYQVPVQVRRLLANAGRLRKAISRYRASLQQVDWPSAAPSADSDDSPF
jgi:hypothetical protein